MNPYRGEHAILIKDKTYTLKFDHNALVNIEQACDINLVYVMSDFQKNWRAHYTVKVLFYGLNGALSEEEILEEVEKKGYMEYQPDIVQGLMLALAGTEAAKSVGEEGDKEPGKSLN